MTTEYPLVIYGAGGLGRELYHLVIRSGKPILGFIDDGIPTGTNVAGGQVLGNSDWLKHNKAEVILAFGDPNVKRKVFDRLAQISNARLSEYISDPKAVILDSSTIELGDGTILTAGSVLTTGIKIGKSVLVNLNTTIGHDTVIGDFTSIMPGCNLAGNVRIGSGVLIGSGANILGGVTIGDGSVVGAGAVVNRDVPAGKTVVGIPAREIHDAAK